MKLTEFVPMSVLPELMGQSPLTIARWRRTGQFKVVMQGSRRMVMARELIGLPLARPATVKDIEALNCGSVDKTWIIAEEAAAIAGCNPATIFNRFKNGEIRGKVIAKKTFFRVDEVEQLQIRPEHQERGRANGQKLKREADQLYGQVWGHIKPLRAEGKSFREIAEALNSQGIDNPMTGKPWVAKAVSCAVGRMEDLEAATPAPDQTVMHVVIEAPEQVEKPAA